MRCSDKDGQAKNSTKKFVLAVMKGLKREIDSVKATGSMEVDVTCEEPKVQGPDEYAEELQNVFDNIIGVRLGPELLQMSRQVVIDFMSKLNVYRKRPRHWATDKGILIIPTKWVDVNKGDARQPEYRSRLCGKELKRWDPTMPGTLASMGPFERVMFLLSKALMWKPGQDVRRLGRSCFLDASRAHCQAEATSEMAIELTPEEQVKPKDLMGDVLKSLNGTRRAAHTWEKKWQKELHDNNWTWSPVIVLSRA